MCPFKTVQFRKECKTWLSDSTKESMILRDVKREHARNTKDPVTWSEYRSLRNETNHMVNSDRKKHYDDIYDRLHTNGDVGGTFKTAKNQAGISKNSSPSSFLHEGLNITDPQAMADLQMEVFSDKIDNLIRELPPPVIDPCSILKKSLDDWGERKDARQEFKFKTITSTDTLKIIKELGNTTSSAHDNLDSLALKHGAAILHGPLTHVINTSINTSKFASRWKIGRLLPLHKGKGLSLTDPKSFRPISLLPVIGKVMERVLQPQILEFMESTGQMNANHHSYRKLHSTVSAMLQLSDAIFSGCEANKITTLVTLDQSAAFDVIRHDTLKQKLRLYNFGEDAINWIDSFLSFRSQYVSIGTRHSKFSSVNTGVPQGSVLGPIFYVLYVNELPTIMNDEDCSDAVHKVCDNNFNLFNNNCTVCGQMPTYADDSTVVITTSSRFEAQERVTKIVDRVSDFLSSNSLSLNLGKTEIVEIMVWQKRALLPGVPPQLSVQKPDHSFKVIKAKDLCRLLGANVNKDANWNHHLDKGEKPLFKTLRSTLGMLGHLAKFLPLRSRLLLANGLFMSRLLYLLPMWGGLPRRDMKKLQTLMNRCARIVLNCSRRTRTRVLMTNCGWHYLSELVDYHTSVLMYKIIFSSKPLNLRNKFFVDPVNRVHTLPGRLKMSRDSFHWRATCTWNAIPDHIISADKISQFKKLLRKHLIESRTDIIPRRQIDLD